MRTPLKVVLGTLLFGMLALPARGQEPAAPDMTTLVNGYERAAHSSFVGHSDRLEHQACGLLSTRARFRRRRPNSAGPALLAAADSARSASIR